jgi:hypothetical protein
MHLLYLQRALACVVFSQLALTLISPHPQILFPAVPGVRLHTFPNHWSAQAMRRKVQLFFATLAVLATTSIAAEPADEIQPPSGYRNWFHVNTMVIDKASPLFEALGGMHNVHVNSVGEAALKKGGPYPDQTVFVSDVHQFTVSDGSYVMGNRKGLAVMVKDAKKYAATGGWGFQLFAGGDPNKPKVTDAAKQCFECHVPQKDQDYVYSTYIP